MAASCRLCGYVFADDFRKHMMEEHGYVLSAGRFLHAPTPADVHRPDSQHQHSFSVAPEHHKPCKAMALRRIERLSYLVHQLMDMKRDDCPAMHTVSQEDLQKVQTAVDELRRTYRFDVKARL